MRIFDCFMFYDEELILDIRLNCLKNYIDYFVIVESKFYHNGNARDLKFDINKFGKFKDKIIYVIQDDLPEGLLELNIDDKDNDKSFKNISNAHLRENYQRNNLARGIVNAEDNDLILISDVDEIPNLENLNLSKIQKDILIFEQYIFYYKLNRYLKNYTWFGTKGCKKKYFKSPQWLRNIKNKDFKFWRIDTLFSNTKYINKTFIKEGGWHFSNLKLPADIELKLNSYLHHYDFQVEKMDIKQISSHIKNNQTIYDMFADKRAKKFAENKNKLDIFDFSKLPDYITKNENKFKDWID